LARPSRNNSDAFEIIDPKIEELPNLRPISVRGDPDSFVSKLQELGVQHAHIHNLAGYPDLAVDYLASALENSKITYDFTVHDYQYWCPRIHLVGVTGQYCGEPKPSSCQRCVDVLGSPFGSPVIWKWRKSYERLLLGARTVFAPSADVADRVKRHIPAVDPVVRPHEFHLPNRVESETLGKLVLQSKNDVAAALRVGVIGHLTPHKGSQVVEEVAKYCVETNQKFRFTVIGTATNSHELSKLRNVKIVGEYKEKDLGEILKKEDFDLIWFPAVAPETFSYTLSHALNTDSQIVAFDIGAISQRLKNIQRGHLIDLRCVGKPSDILFGLSTAYTKTKNKNTER
jgi:glycosyltransferase involved in cell wall biosynthesis